MPLYILSGGPGCGKSSVILYLERQHKHIVHEAAESTIRAHQALGQPHPWEHAGFQRDIWDLMTIRLRRLPDEDVFLDRYYTDTIAYCKANNTLSELPADHDTLIDTTIPVFFFEPLAQHEQNKVRREDRSAALAMHHRLLDEYTQRGFTIITVPVGTVEWRTRYVLEHVEEIKKGK